MVSGKASDPTTIGYSNLGCRYPRAKLPRSTKVKNKSPAAIQITAEQILREARDRVEAGIRAPNHNITDSTELADYRLRHRTEFENQIRRARRNSGVWVKYARWEESQEDFARARSVWERALDVDSGCHSIWLKYAEFEMRNKFLNSARNVWDRAVTQLPRVDQLWYKYIHMEEMIGNVAGARQIFERWMNWAPDQQGWLSYVKFELRYNEIERARSIFERFILCHPTFSAYFRYAKFEMKRGEMGLMRNVYERALEKFRDDEDAKQLFSAFPVFGEHRNVIGDEEAIVVKKRSEYEDEVKKNPLNYDAWFDYIRLEESVGSIKDKNRRDGIRELYERAIANVPPVQVKHFWQRYIYFWINYALFEELETEDVERTREVYRQCLNLIPHHKFSFAKVWWLAAQFEIRQLNLKGARRILGNAIGKAPKDKIFKRYIEMELQLGNADRCRKLYERYLEWSPVNCYAWSKYAELEAFLFETERARAIFELAISQPVLDTPELLWKAYIAFEMCKGRPENARTLYERLQARIKAFRESPAWTKTFEESPAKISKLLEVAYKWKEEEKRRM